MWTHATNQHMVAVKHQMLRSDGGSQPFISVTDIVGSIFGGDVLKNDFQRSQALAQRFHHAFNKARFTIKNVDICMCHFTMHQ